MSDDAKRKVGDSNQPEQPWTPRKVRQRIQVGHIVNKLQKVIDGTLNMTAAQLRAAELLLNKALPTPQEVEFNDVSDKAETMQDLLLRGKALGLSEEMLFGSARYRREGEGQELAGLSDAGSCGTDGAPEENPRSH